ncbi:hypothetical protein ACGTN9_00875 [Halobacillus sp. MO56]
MAKRTKKNDAQQKNKKGFDSSKTDTEFSKELGSAKANQAHREKAKQERKSNKAGNDLNKGQEQR